MEQISYLYIKNLRLQQWWEVRFHILSLSKPNVTLSKKCSLSLLISLQTNLTHHSRCLWVGCFDCARRADEWRILAEREVKRACRLTSGRHVERWHGWMIPTEGHALLKLGLGRASTWETACALFFQQMAALRQLEGKDRRQNGRRGDKLWVFFPLFSSHLYDFCFLFTPNHCLGTETWQNLFLFVSRQWFDIVSASALEPRWPGVPLLLNVQWFKKNHPSGFHYSFTE